ncbi:conserved Plasmodium protein, unknown function [Plasmodium yoelii]|uniref:Uncharacterized protein n=3 Tax=Plasmodium yoelii TaxID=5861 RepID=A0AAE9WLW7_PLAYO|nr:conserved Plasmodium protein, unknown function [Plasmodium yoelii]WBY54950.1 hypothetical protein Py17XNL_000303614 [Plasmodium yoelii yoelii]CDU16226.1 conserved Plasmodium protein, unknown function [Plasmodium yoelii]VTZ72410.1 conserved Plasmodium protein, unknown function [Plasmodium yoelii]|eukprot:XP_728846.2 conserved Plasmodium protein, unknown function [Plasmodium yoelii]
MGFVKAEEFVNHYMRINKEIKELSERKNEEFKFNIFVFYYNNIDSICTEHILQFHKKLKREINVYSYGIEKKDDIFNLLKKYDDIYLKNKEFYRDYFFCVILIGICSHINTDTNIYDEIGNFFSNILDKHYSAYLKFYVIDNKRPFHDIFLEDSKWNLVMSESEHNEVMRICQSLDKFNDSDIDVNENNKKLKKFKKKNYQKLYDHYNIVKEENKCMCLLLYPYIQCINKDDATSIIFISSISLLSYLKTDQITHEYYNKQIKNLYNDILNISDNNFVSFEHERGLLPMLSFISLNDALEIDERIYIYDHKNVKNTFNKIRTMCDIENKEFTGNFRQLDLKKQNEILVKLKNLIKIIKPMTTLGWKRRTYLLYNSDSFYFILILIYVYINRDKKMETYLYNCLKTSDFLFNIFKDRLKQSEIYDKLIETHLHKNAANYLSVLIKKVMESNKKLVNITSHFKIYIDIIQTAKNTYTHPFELKFISTIFSSFQSYCTDKYKTYHLIVCHINDSDDTILYGFTPLNKKDYWVLIFSRIAYSNSEQIIYDTISDVNTIKIKKNDLRFILDEIKHVFRSIIKTETQKKILGENELADLEVSGNEDDEQDDEQDEQNEDEHDEHDEDLIGRDGIDDD